MLWTRGFGQTEGQTDHYMALAKQAPKKQPKGSDYGTWVSSYKID